MKQLRPGSSGLHLNALQMSILGAGLRASFLDFADNVAGSGQEDWKNVVKCLETGQHCIATMGQVVWRFLLIGTGCFLRLMPLTFWAVLHVSQDVLVEAIGS